jgi:hypothetical protein
MPLEFSDGMKFNLEGELRIERRSDGLYVVGKGMLQAVETREEGLDLIKSLNKGREEKSRANQ